MDTKLGQKLKQLRIKHNLSCEQLLKKLEKHNLHYTVQSIYKWEHGATPSILVIKALSSIYKCPIEYFIDDEHKTIVVLTPVEIFLLKLYRTNILFREIATLIIQKYQA